MSSSLEEVKPPTTQCNCDTACAWLADGERPTGCDCKRYPGGLYEKPYAPSTACPECKGSGSISRVRATAGWIWPCDACIGTGQQPAQPAPRDWLLRKGGYFYRPGSAGYTASVGEAGRYTADEARKHVDGASGEVTMHHVSEWPAQPGSGEVKRYTPNSIANEIMAEDAWHDSQWVRAADYDRLQSALTEAQRELASERHAFQNFHRSLCARFGYFHDAVDFRRDQVSLEEHIAQRLAELEKDSAFNKAGWDGAFRQACGNGAAANELRRERDELYRALDAVISERDAAFAQVDRMRAKLPELAGECAECGGTGKTTVRGMCGGVEMDCDEQPCPDCKDIRESAK